MRIVCPQCKKEADLPVGAINRAQRRGRPIYCGRPCSGLARRKYKAIEQKKEEKRLYDIEYRNKKKDCPIWKKARTDYFKRTYDAAKQHLYNQSRMALHIEYCRRPEYKAKKKKFDRVYRAKKFYGDFWEQYLLILDINEEALKRQSRYEIMLEKGVLTKAQTRRRNYEKLNRAELETIPMGNLIRA